LQFFNVLSLAAESQMRGASRILADPTPLGRLVCMSKIVLPYEPEYVGDREAEQRRKETKEWLRNRERELDNSLSIVPERAPEDEKAR
jgi:hypothetical protein